MYFKSRRLLKTLNCTDLPTTLNRSSPSSRKQDRLERRIVRWTVDRCSTTTALACSRTGSYNTRQLHPMETSSTRTHPRSWMSLRLQCHHQMLAPSSIRITRLSGRQDLRLHLWTASKSCCCRMNPFTWTRGHQDWRAVKPTWRSRRLEPQTFPRQAQICCREQQEHDKLWVRFSSEVSPLSRRRFKGCNF